MSFVFGGYTWYLYDSSWPGGSIPGVLGTLWMAEYTCSLSPISSTGTYYAAVNWPAMGFYVPQDLRYYGLVTGSLYYPEVHCYVGGFSRDPDSNGTLRSLRIINTQPSGFYFKHDNGTWLSLGTPNNPGNNLSATKIIDAGSVSNLILYTTNPALEAPTNPSPPNGATNQPVSPTLSWSSPDCSTSHLQIATDTNFTNIVVDVNPGVCSYIASLNCGTTYYWRVSHAQSGWSETWSFSTVACLSADYKYYPADLALLTDSFTEPLSLFSSSLRCYTLWKALSKEGDAHNYKKSQIFRKQYQMYKEATKEIYFGRNLKAKDLRN